MAQNERDNLSVVLHKPNDVRLQQWPVPQLVNENDVLLRIDTVGICGSDVHLSKTGSLLNRNLTDPIIMGHESSGTVMQVGKNVTHLKPNDRVAIEPGHGCGKCDQCRHGNYNICSKYILYCAPPQNGLLTKYHVHPAEWCFKLPSTVSLEEGALIEPLSVAVHGCRKAKISIDDHVMIVGAGPIGLSTLLVAKSMGAANITVMDISAVKLEKAKQLGATQCVLINPKLSEIETLASIENVLESSPSKAMDCVGMEHTLRLCINLARPGGTVIMTGLAHAEIKIPAVLVIRRELKLYGSFAYCHEYPIAIELLASGKVDMMPLVTHRFKIEDFLEALNAINNGGDNVIKMLIKVN